jgi:uncharacterized membrane protein
MIAALTFRFAHPWWLLAAALVVPMAYLAWKPLAGAGPVRRVAAVVVRVLVVLLLAALLADPLLTRIHDAVTVVAIVDRSLSVPAPLREGSLAYLNEALANHRPGDRLAVIDVAESALIEKLATTDISVQARAVSLTGEQTNLAAALQLALAIAPPDSAARFLIVSDGNETLGDLREAARVAAANRIPVDALPLAYRYPQEVFFRRLISPPNASSGQTVALRFVLESTAPARGKILLTLNGRPVHLDPKSDSPAAAVELRAGTTVRTVSLPVGTRGLHEFEATFIPDGPGQDTLVQNNKASSVTYVAGPGHVVAVDEDGRAAGALVRALRASGIDARHMGAGEFPDNLSKLLDTDAILLVNTSAAALSLGQQELLVNYVRELGGGLVMVGGPQSFGAGGWIGSPVAEVLPVDVDPPQKKQMPKGALVLVMHSCEMPQGNYWGKMVAAAAVNALSRLDLAGVVSYGWDQSGMWDYPLGPVGDKQPILAAIKNMQMGDMPDFTAPMKATYEALTAVKAGQKHVILISDGDPGPPSDRLLSDFKEAAITCTGVAVFPHSAADVQSLSRIAQATGGRFYNVKDPNELPQIFVKEALTVKRALINEQTFTPKVLGGLNPIIRGLEGVPALDGYVFTGPKGGASELLMLGPQEDPILAGWQVGVGRCAAFTSSVDGRWAAAWLRWGGFGRFWEQTVRWVAKSRQSAECVVFADVQGRQVTLTAEALDREGNFVQFSGMTARVIGPDMKARDVEMVQVGPGQYRAAFAVGQSGSYLASLRYRKAGAGEGGGMVQSVITVPYAPEFCDLSDNASLLSEVARDTGGRVLPGDPKHAEVFSRQGLKFPETPVPLATTLMIVWVGLFLTDVAVRRLAVDFRSLARRVAAFVRRPFVRRPADEEARLAQLRTRTRQVRKKMAPAGTDAAAARRFEAPAGAKTVMPDASAPAAAEKPAAPAAPKPQATPEPGASHLDKLLSAKRRAMKGKDKEPDKDDSDKEP